MISFALLIIMFLIVHNGQAISMKEEVIDLNKSNTRPDQCVLSQLNSTTPPLKIRVIAPMETRCFRVYNEENCTGRHIKFSSVSTQVLLLRYPGSGVMRLQNFNLQPRSFQSCEGKVENHSVAPIITSDSNQCSRIEVETHAKAYWQNPWVEQFFLSNDCNHISSLRDQKSGGSLSINLKQDGNQQIHCIEMYSHLNCIGQSVQMLIPPESINKNQHTLALWEYSYTHPVDIYVKSVRSCSQCLLKDKIQFPQTENSDSEQESDESMISSQRNPHQVPRVSLNGCKTIFEYLKNSTIDDVTSRLRQDCSIDNDCFIVFNTPTCYGKSLSELQFKNSLPRTVSQLRNWSVARCCRSFKTYPYRPEHDNYKLSLIHTNTFVDSLKIFKEGKPAKPSNYKISQLEIIILTVSGSLALIMVIIVIILSILLWRRKKRLAAARRIIARAKLQQQRALSIRLAGSVVGNVYAKPLTSLDTLCGTFTTKGYAIPKLCLDIGNTRDSTASIIGIGEHSIVYKGILNRKTKQTVAVKTLKSGHDTIKSIKRALQECSIILELGKHEKIIKLIGVCLENVSKGEIYMIYEYYSKGSLRSFLTQNRKKFVNLVIDGDTIDEKLVANASPPNEEEATDELAKFDTYQVLRWCFEIADVMEFLASRQIVHLSLSARNVMLDFNLACKLSDFQFAKTRTICSNPNNEIENAYRDRTIPWRYMAIESILEETFTTWSDVWTFGIFMWELFSLGGIPYPEYNYCTDFTMSIKHGYRLMKPKYSTTECFELMLLCWYDAPERRPTFTKLKSKLHAMLPETVQFDLKPTARENLESVENQ